MAEVYEVIVKDPSTGKLWELLPKSYNFIEKLNAEPQATFNLSFDEVKKMAERNDTTVINIFTAALREIWISRNGIKIFYGVVSDFDVTPGGIGERNLVVKAMGFFGLFKKRLVGKGTTTVYTATDAGDIAWDLIDDSQLSDSPYSTYGITQGATPATINRDRQYLFDNIYDSIIKLSNENLENGFDFDIDTTKAFNVYYPTKGANKLTVVFDERTMNSWKYRKSLFTEMVNSVFVIGEGFNEAINYQNRVAGIGYRTPFGTLEEKLDARNTTENATLQDKGDRRLLDARDPVITLDQVTHFDNEILWSDYNLGDTIIVNMPDLSLNNVQRRVVEKTFTMETPQSIAKISVKLKTI